jgi:hypothetical protein
MEISRYASRLTAHNAAPVHQTSASRSANAQSQDGNPALAAHPPRPIDASTDLDPARGTDRSLGDSALSPSLSIPVTLPQEPEDARITGGTRSLSRRLLALNIPEASFPRRAVGKAGRSASAQKAKAGKAPALSAQWVGQDA